MKLLKKEDDEWISVENFYSSAKEGKATIRGLAAEPISMKFRVRDRWDNYSDFLETENLPLIEEELDKSLFREIAPLPGDVPALVGNEIRKIWDGNTVNSCFVSTVEGSFNALDKTITFDLGKK